MYPAGQLLLDIFYCPFTSTTALSYTPQLDQSLAEAHDKVRIKF